MLIIVGASLIVLGIYVRSGGYKRLYVTPNRLPVIAPQAYKNALIPAGISLLLLGLSLLDLVLTVEMRRALWGYIVFPSFLVSIILGVLSPRWLKPRWLVYLEDTYGRDFTHIVLLPAAGNDPGGWAQQMCTLGDVKMWAAGIAEQQGFPPELGQADREAWRQQHGQS